MRAQKKKKKETWVNNVYIYIYEPPPQKTISRCLRGKGLKVHDISRNKRTEASES